MQRQLAVNELVKMYFGENEIKSCFSCLHRDAEELLMLDGNVNNFLLSNIIISCGKCIDELDIGKNYGVCEIFKEFEFDSAHHLPNHGGLCKNLHGHRYKLRVYIKSFINKDGFVMDFSYLKRKVNNTIVNLLDHELINKYIQNPTAENMLYWIWKKLEIEGKLKGISRISLYETPTSCATLTKEMLLEGGWIVLYNEFYNSLMKESQLHTCEQPEIKIAEI